MTPEPPTMPPAPAAPPPGQAVPADTTSTKPAVRPRLRRLDLGVAALLFLGVTAIALAVSPAQGVHRDESYYMDAGEQYVAWWERALTGREARPFSKQSIERYWSYNFEHPPLMKTLYGLSWRIFHRCDCAAEKAWHPGVGRLETGRHVTLGLMSEVTAFRFPTMICFGLLAALVYLFGLQAFGSRAGALAAALLTACQPRAFFHAGTASFDLPAAFFWFATSYAYWRALSGRTVAALGTGLLYGLFLATKLQSFFLPLALGAHWLWLGVVRRRRGQRWPTIKPLVAMAVVAPLTLFALWPLLWHDTVRHVRDYLAFHLKHVHYNFEYLGQNWNRPPYPWHEPLGMLLYTAPVVLLALGALGIGLMGRDAVRGLRRPPAGPAAADDRATRALVFLGMLVPMAPFFRGTVPIFGETKHWLASTPNLALCAGVAVAAIAARLSAELRLDRWYWRQAPAGAAALLIFAAVAPAAVETARSHPYGLSHYNALAGGAPGGADLGMNRHFWGYAANGLFPWINTHLARGARLYLHDAEPVYRIDLRDGRLRPDIASSGDEKIGGITRSDAALVIHEKHFNKYEYLIWSAYGHVRPATVLTLDGVPLVTLYLRHPDTKERPTP